MKTVRKLTAMATFIVGLFAFAGGLFVASVTFMLDIGHPLDVGAVVGGLVAMVIGLGFWWISRAAGGDDGPIKDYRKRPKKRRN